MDMARDIIQLSGFIPDKDILIQVVGLRPGEKLHEELITQGEDIVKTDREDIMVLNADGNIPLSQLQREILSLVELAKRADAEGIKLGLQKIVPEYTPEMSVRAEGEKVGGQEAEVEKVRGLEGEKINESRDQKEQTDRRSYPQITPVPSPGATGQAQIPQIYSLKPKKPYL